MGVSCNAVLAKCLQTRRVNEDSGNTVATGFLLMATYLRVDCFDTKLYIIMLTKLSEDF